MNILKQARAAFAVGDAITPLGRALLAEQFRVLRKQVPVLYTVLLVDSISVGAVLPSTVSAELRFVVPAALLYVCLFRLASWLRLKLVDFNPEEAYKELARTRVVAAALNTGCILWILALFHAVEPGLRAPVALRVFMGCFGTAYCLGSFPPASRLTMLIAGPPIAEVLLLT